MKNICFGLYEIAMPYISMVNDSGLIQIRKYAEIQSIPELLEQFGNISRLSRIVKDELYRVLTEEAGYFC